MLLSDTIQTAIAGITVNKTRSVLTTLGIIIGVGSVVLMISVGKSFQNYILTQIESIGTNTMDVFPVGIEKFGGNLQSLTEDDYEAVKRLSTVSNVAPVIIVAKPVEYGRETVNPMVFGTLPQIFSNYGLKLADGRLLEQGDIEGASSNAVVSAQTAKNLFGDQNPLGKHITIGEASFTIVGVLKSQGSLLLSDLDKPVYIPFTTARVLTGQKNLTYMTLKTIGDPALAKEDITLLLRDRHHIKNPENDADKDDFIARSAEQITSIVSSVTLGLTIFLSLIAGISLLVGGIGIMNIMLVSVTERTREIGLRMAIGARGSDVLLQFLVEAVVLSAFGGSIGIGLGFALSEGLTFWMQWPTQVPLNAVAVAFGFAAATGVFFGFYPARKAAALDPIEALRFE